MLFLTIGFLFLIPSTFAADTVFQGGGLQQGFQQAQNIQGVSQAQPRQIVTNILNQIMTFLGLIAALAFVVSGLMFMLSFGNDQTHTKAKNAAIYAIVGLLVILFARAIISLIQGLG